MLLLTQQTRGLRFLAAHDALPHVQTRNRTSSTIVIIAYSLRAGQAIFPSRSPKKCLQWSADQTLVGYKLHGWLIVIYRIKAFLAQMIAFLGNRANSESCPLLPKRQTTSLKE